MKSLLKNWVTLVTGQNTTTLAEYDVNSRNKAYLLSMIVIIPAIIWTLQGYLISSITFGLPITQSISCSILLGLFILLIEIIIMRVPKNRIITVIRFLLALLIAYIGAIFGETAIFNRDIKSFAIEKFKSKQHEMLDELKIDLSEATKVYFDEIDGIGGSNSRGHGVIAQKKEDQIVHIKENLTKFDSTYQDALKILADPQHKLHRKYLEEIGLSTLLGNIHIYHELIKKDSYVLFTSLIIMIFIMILEILPILIKTFHRKSAYELDLEAQEQLLHKRRAMILQQAKYNMKLKHIMQNNF